MRHFLDISQLSVGDLQNIINLAIDLKARLKSGDHNMLLPGVQLAMIFEKPSTRTRTSFEVGINQLGGRAVILNTENSQLGRGETISDTAMVLSRYVDLIMIRCFKHDTLLELAQYSSVPVINGLTDYNHPCQVMADIMTFQEHKGNIQGKNIAWIGDGNNMTTSWINAARVFGFNLHIATPKQYKPEDKLLEHDFIKWTDDPVSAVKGADAVNTDTWVSMGDKDAEQRMETLRPFQITSELMEHSNSDSIFLHCLPAHRGEEVTAEVIDGPRSVILDEAENRLHVQKAIMIWCLQRTSPIS